jgi:hypothetical protein
MARLAQPLPPPPNEQVVTPAEPIPVVVTLVWQGQEFDVPAAAEAWTPSQLVRIYWVHPHTRQEYVHWLPSTAIRRTVDRHSPA